MRIYNCTIQYERTGVSVYSGEKFEKDIWVRAKNIKEAIGKASHYQETNEVKKVLEVLSADLAGTIDKD